MAAALAKPKAWLDHHAYSLVSSLGRFARKPWSTLLTIGVMAVALALPLGLWLVLDNVGRFAGSAQQSRQIALFLEVEVDAARASAMAGTLRQREDVAVVEVRTPEQGLAELREQGGLDAAVDALDENPLPTVLLVTPAGDGALLADSLRDADGVHIVQHDAEWRRRLDGWLRFGGRVALVLALLLGLGALLVVGNTVRLDIQARRDEIGVLQLLGASDGFIRRPFLYLGAWYGLGAGLLALALLTATHLALQAPLAELSASYGSDFALEGLGAAQAGWVLLGAMALGWLGAGVVTGHFLRQTRPVDA